MSPENINHYVELYGAIAIFLLMFSNGILSTPPSEVVLAAAGALASARYESILSVTTSAIAGNLAGALTLYSLGKRLGYSWVQSGRGWASDVHMPRLVVDIVFPDEQTIHKLSETLRSHGAAWIGVFRCVPILRSIISLPAGMVRMPVFRFTGWSFAGITVWSVLWISVGYSFHANWHRAGGHLYRAFLVVFCIAVIFVGKLVVKNYYHRDR